MHADCYINDQIRQHKSHPTLYSAPQIRKIYENLLRIFLYDEVKFFAEKDLPVWGILAFEQNSPKRVLPLVARAHGNFTSRLRPYGSVEGSGIIKAQSFLRVSSFVDMVCTFHGGKGFFGTFTKVPISVPRD